jgi:hypothetical protein
MTNPPRAGAATRRGMLGSFVYNTVGLSARTPTGDSQRANGQEGKATMSLHINIQVGTLKFAEKLDLVELEALQVESRRSESLASAFDTVFDASESADSRTVPCGTLLAAIATLREQARSGTESWVYYLYSTPTPGLIPKGSSSGVGIEIGGRRGLVTGGVNECTVTFFEQDQTGAWKQASQDVSHLKVIRNDDGTEIEIRKRRKVNFTSRLLRRLEEALRGCPTDAEALVTLG